MLSFSKTIALSHGAVRLEIFLLARKKITAILSRLILPVTMPASSLPLSLRVLSFLLVLLGPRLAVHPAWASGSGPGFKAYMVSTPEGHLDVKWPVRAGYFYTLQYSTSLRARTGQEKGLSQRPMS